MFRTLRSRLILSHILPLLRAPPRRRYHAPPVLTALGVVPHCTMRSTHFVVNTIVFVVKSRAKSSVRDYLMFGINQSLAVVPLDDAMGRLHLGRLVVRHVAADLLARGPEGRDFAVVSGCPLGLPGDGPPR